MTSVWLNCSIAEMLGSGRVDEGTGVDPTTKTPNKILGGDAP